MKKINQLKMKKSEAIKDKENKIYNLKKSEIESIDRDITNFYFKIIIGISTAYIFLLVNFKSEKFYIIISSVIYFLMFFFIGIMDYQSYKYISDCYDSLVISIKNDSVLDYKIPEMKSYEHLLYKRKYR